MATRKKAPLDFEQSLAELQQLVERLEGGELSLEESLSAFEQGIRLTRDCQGALGQAEDAGGVSRVEHRMPGSDQRRGRSGDPLHPFVSEPGFESQAKPVEPASPFVRTGACPPEAVGTRRRRRWGRGAR